LALVVLVAGVVGLLAGVGYSLLRERPPALPVAPSPTAANVPAADAPSADTAAVEAPSRLVEALPRFQLADRDGQLRSLQDWPDRALIVNFWATWCAPCRREIPLLQEIARERADEGFTVVGIAVDFRDKVLAYADEMKIDYPLLIGEQDGLDAAAAFGVQSIGFPFTVFSDRQGRIVTAHLGELHRNEADVILDAVARVNRGELSLADAQQAITAALTALQPPETVKSTE
jgi:thiol-disulfide isomerase/thioredoxin